MAQKPGAAWTSPPSCAPSRPRSAVELVSGKERITPPSTITLPVDAPAPSTTGPTRSPPPTAFYHFPTRGWHEPGNQPDRHVLGLARRDIGSRLGAHLHRVAARHRRRRAYADRSVECAHYPRQHSTRTHAHHLTAQVVVQGVGHPPVAAARWHDRGSWMTSCNRTRNWSYYSAPGSRNVRPSPNTKPRTHTAQRGRLRQPWM